MVPSTPATSPPLLTDPVSTDPVSSDPPTTEAGTPGLVTPGRGEAYRFWLELGFVSFGGPAGQIAILHRELVERRRWVSEERFLHALNYCMLLPGPEAQQLATYLGWLLHGVRGGIVAGGLFVLPSVFVLLGLSWVYAAHGHLPAVAGALWGVRPVVVAIVVAAVLRIGRRAVRRRIDLLLATAALLAIYALGVPFPAVVVGAALLGWLAHRLRRARRADDTPSQAAPAPAAGGAARRLPAPGPSAAVLGVGLVLWLGGLALVAALLGPASLYAQQYFFFTRAAFVTFGGAYAVLAYVAQAAVGSLGWLGARQVIDGLALAETTPGPAIMVVQFVGFMAGWNHPQGLTPLAGGLLGAGISTFVTFLPSFVFILVGAPYVEALRGRRSLDAALSAVMAAVVGVIANLALVFGTSVLLPSGGGGVDAAAVAIAAAALLAVWRWRVGVVWVVLAGLAVGLLRTLVGG